MNLFQMLQFARSMGFTFQPAPTPSAGPAAPARRRTPPPDAFAPHAEPQPAGVALLRSGEFGSVKVADGQHNIARTLRARECGQRHSHTQKEELVRVRYSPSGPPLFCLHDGHYQPLVPNSNGTVVATFEDNVYAGQYSEDGNFFYTCCRGM